MHINAKKAAYVFMLTLAGNVIYALAVVMFLDPNGLITGGTTGLALFAHRMWGVSIGMAALVMNAVLYFIGWAALGREFAVTTALSTALYPLCLYALEQFPQIAIVTDTPMLAVIYSGLMIGVGIGLVMRAGGSTGGMDVPPLMLKKFFNLNVSMTMYAFDVVILLMQVSQSDKMGILYGILLVLIYTVVLDRVLIMGASRMQLKIVSQKYEDINRCLTDELDCGTTMLKAKTGFFGDECMLIMSVINTRDLPRVNRAVLNIDPEAFVIVGQINEVKGRGYTLDRVHRTRSHDEKENA